MKLYLPPEARFLQIHLTNQGTGAPIDGGAVKIVLAHIPIGSYLKEVAGQAMQSW